MKRKRRMLPPKPLPVMPSCHTWDGEKMVLFLPLPDQAISPNARRGESKWAAMRKARLVKLHRERARLAVTSLMALHGLDSLEAVGYSLAFYFKTAAYRDDDNADAACKAYRDGIADALRMDDRNLRKIALSTHAKDKDCPRVEISLFAKP
jgi:hypothetical protein